jgi:hypothetical protein
MPQIIPFSQTSGSDRVRSAIANASARTGVGFNYLYNQAVIESSLNPAAQAKTSSAQGLFQFTSQTWLKTVKAHGAEHGLAWAAEAITQNKSGRFQVPDAGLRASILDLRTEPEAASTMAAELAADNTDIIGVRLGKVAEPVDLYLSHFLGTAGAIKFLSEHARDRGQSAAPLFPDAAAANRSIFYAADGRMLSLEHIRSRFASRFDVVAPAGRELPSVHSEGVIPANNPAPGWRPSGENVRSHPLQFMQIEPMPASLSLDFARRAYQRLADMGGAAQT